MERRDFIKALSSALVAVPSTTLTLKKQPEVQRAPIAGFNPGLPYGNAVHLKDRTQESVSLGRELLLRDARERLPRGTRFYVLDGGHARVYGEGGEPQEIDMLAWYYSPGQLSGPRVGQVIAEVIA